MKQHRPRAGRRRWLALIAFCALGPVRTAWAQPSPADWIAGTIVRIDAEAGRITLRHGGIGHLYLSAGETTLRYTEQRFINGRSAGDQVRFRADRIELELRLTGLFFLGR